MTYSHAWGGADLLGCCLDCGRPRTDPAHPPVPSNATGSPTGRTRRDSPESSRHAAAITPARSHRSILHTALLNIGTTGMTCIQAASLLPLTRQGTPQVSNRAVSRLGELWEEGHATVVRDWGFCVLGVCHPHDKAAGVIHRPTAACDVHGPPVTRDGASVWVAVTYTPAGA